ncbi:MAG TPA: hypothetical protein PK733_08075 [Clostridiales bacterium]|nr:hypothetical protein [Clostridiales bacterium]
MKKILVRGISESAVEPFNLSGGRAKSVFEQNNYNSFIQIIL